MSDLELGLSTSPPAASTASPTRSSSNSDTTPPSSPESPATSPHASELKLPLLEADCLGGSGGFDDNPEHHELNCLARTQKHLADAYDVVADSIVGTVIRAIALSMPQCLILSGASGYATSGLITPLVFKEISTEAQAEDFFFYSAIIDALVLTTSLLYDTGKRLQSHYQQGSYTSYGVFRWRATCMGAALGGILMNNFMDLAAPQANPWLTFSVTLPATLFPAYLKHRYFTHNIVPGSLNRTEAEIAREPQETKDASKTGLFNNRVFNSVAQGASSAGAALLMYRVLRSMKEAEHRKFTPLKTAVALTPFLLGSLSVLTKNTAEKFNFRWKQLEILTGDSAMLCISLLSFFVEFNGGKEQSYIREYLQYVAFTFSVSMAAIQASRLQSRKTDVRTTDSEMPTLRHRSH